MLSPTFSSSVYNKNLLLLPRFPSVVVAFFACVASVGCCCCCGVSIRQKRGNKEGNWSFVRLEMEGNGGKNAIFSLIAHSGYASMSYTFFTSSNLSGTLNPMSSQRSVLRPFFSSSCIPPTISFFSTTISQRKRTKIEGKYCSFYLRKVETREEGHLNFLIRRLRQHRGSYLSITK